MILSEGEIWIRRPSCDVCLALPRRLFVLALLLERLRGDSSDWLIVIFLGGLRRLFVTLVSNLMPGRIDLGNAF